MNKAVWIGWSMYAVSFVLPMMDTWGYDAFWVYFEDFFKWEDGTGDPPTRLAINLSNVVMILSPLLLRLTSARVLGALLILGGLHNSRFLWDVGEDASFLTEIFPAYYVWWTSFFVVGFGLWRTPSLRS